MVMSGNGNVPTKRVICLRSTDENFYLAVKRPFDKHTRGFNAFCDQASAVHELDEGSQVFVYPRESFDYGPGGGLSAEAVFDDFAWHKARELGHVAIDTTIVPVSSKAESTHFMDV